MKRIRLHDNRIGKRGVWPMPVSSELATPVGLPAVARGPVRRAVAASAKVIVDVHAIRHWRTERPHWNRGEAQWEIHRGLPGILMLTETGDDRPELSLSMHYAKLVAGMEATARAATSRLVAMPAAWACKNWYPAAKPVVHIYQGPGPFGQAPREASAGYDDVYKEMSKRLQAVLREWMPMHLLAPGGLGDTPARTAAVLAWTASRPVTGEHVDELSPNVLVEYLIVRSLRSAQHRMSQLLEQLAPALANAPEPIALDFHPDASERVMDLAVREKPLLIQLYQAESRVIESLVQFFAHGRQHAEALRLCRDGENRDARLALEELWRECVNALRRFPAPQPPYQVLHRLLIAALDVLEEAAGGGGNTHQVNWPYAA
jgi:hypothetical protein